MTHCFFLHKITWKDVVIATRLETRQVNEACQGKKPEGGISSAEEIYLNDDVTFDFTFYRSIVWFQNYAQIRIYMDIIAFVRSALGELRPRRLWFEQTALLIIYSFFFDFASRLVCKRVDLYPINLIECHITNQHAYITQNTQFNVYTYASFSIVILLIVNNINDILLIITWNLKWFKMIFVYVYMDVRVWRDLSFLRHISLLSTCVFQDFYRIYK